ncbi:MAG: lipopolysaccharide heptosyltransferase I, partial [Pseudomonadota bacterium]|nr:lipopolysaccharide heptosyltransferase I [Pseudomonadota bacterium]
MKVLMIKVSALGDIIHALPVASYLKSCPQIRKIHWLLEEQFSPLLVNQPLIDKIQLINTKKWRQQGIIASIKGIINTISRLRREKYDLVLDLQGNSKSGIFTRFSGAPLRFGFDAQNVREWPNLLATNRKITPGKSATHIIDKNLALATSAFPESPPPPLQGPLQADLHYLNQVEKKLSAIRKEKGPLIIFHYGTTWETKLWSIESWIELSRSLWKTRAIPPLLTWGNEEELDAVKRIASACPHTIIWPRGNLEELMALLKIADLVVGGDTGPIHIAAALGTPTISYYRGTDHRRNGPRG